MENEPFRPPTPPAKLRAAPPFMPYQNHTLVPRRSIDALLGFGLSLCVPPAALFGALWFVPGVGLGILCVGSTVSLAMGLAGYKEIRESNGLVYGRPLAVVAICISLGIWLLMIAGLALAALVGMLFRY